MDHRENNHKKRTFNGKYQFNGSKLKLAREFHCMTVSELSQYLEVSHTMVSSYENGGKIPTEERIKKIIEVLKFPRTFFFTTIFIERNKTSPNFFRKGAAVPKKYQIQVEANTKIFSGLRNYIESKKINLPKFKML